MVEQRIENSCVAGSSPACGTNFRIATANSKISLLMKPKTLSCFICPHSIMDNTLVYEAGDCGSIPYAGTKFC